jgi:hypothetical protein
MGSEAQSQASSGRRHSRATSDNGSEGGLSDGGHSYNSGHSGDGSRSGVYLGQHTQLVGHEKWGWWGMKLRAWEGVGGQSMLAVDASVMAASVMAALGTPPATVGWRHYLNTRRLTFK